MAPLLVLALLVWPIHATSASEPPSETPSETPSEPATEPATEPAPVSPGSAPSEPAPTTSAAPSAPATAAPAATRAPAATSAAASADATDADAEEALAAADIGPRPWAVGGFVDTQYILNTNFPDTHVFRGTAVSSHTGEFSPNLLVAYFRHDPTTKSPYILEVALQYGASVDALYSLEPDPGQDDGRPFGVEVWKHIGRAHAGVRVGNTEIDAGLMAAPTHFGSFWTKDNWHSSITWGYSSVPFFLTGLRVQHQFGDKVAVAGWLVNGYGTMGDANKAPSAMASLFITPVDDLLLVQNVYLGPEAQDLRPVAWRLLSDTQVIYNTDRWGIAAVGDYGQERLTAEPGAPLGMWANGMVSVRRHLAGKRHRWQGALRPEIFWERRGVIYGGPDRTKTLIAGTITTDVRLWDAILIRAEYRYDRAFAPSGFFYHGAAVTDDAVGLARDQHSVIFNLIGYFERLLPEGRR